MNIKPKIFDVTRTPKGLDNTLTFAPEIIAQRYCAVINVSDSPCATFDYQLKVPSFWFPINEIGQWGHSPFYGAMRVVNQYWANYTNRPVLIHCHAGANRSPSVAYAILLAKGYTPAEAEESLNYEELSQVFQRNIDRKHIPTNVIDFLKVVDAQTGDSTLSLHGALMKIDALYDELAQKKFGEQNDYVLKSDKDSGARLVYSKEKKRYIIVKD